MAPGCAIERHAAVCNAEVEDFLRNNRQKEHRRKVERARSELKTGWSAGEVDKLQFLHQNAKKDRLREDRLGVIERENHRLLSRMHEISKRPRQGGLGKMTAQMVLGAPGTSGARSSSAPHIRKQTITPARMAELRRIDEENKRILKRIQGAKPSINRAKLDEAASQQQKLMRMRCEQPGPRTAPQRVAKEQEDLVYYDTPRDDIDLQQELANLGNNPSFIAAPSNEVLAHEMQMALEGANPSEAACISDLAGEPIEEHAAEPARKPQLGGEIPLASRMLTEALMQEHFGDHLPTSPAAQVDSGGVPPEEGGDWEAEAAAAKEAAQKAFRQAQALDQESSMPWSDGLEMLSYELVVKRGVGASSISPPPRRVGGMATAW
mmetsp:Transcript_62261/g.148593  ORF Transcript_62261/g.148593 Transcript_62261/m.148593 type:complete len:379 (+) Transcript_62261:45-1181(+)